MNSPRRLCRRASSKGVWCAPVRRRRLLSSSAFEHLSRPVQSYISLSRDPIFNLSVEHYLLQKTAPESAVLFLYVNRPSIIIGRNQNPWLEVNLASLHSARHQPGSEASQALGTVQLVRRRSGGGTVFHDEGNVNWTVICPTAAFTRDKHAEMVVRALRSQGVGRSRVNARHDIVLDQGEKGIDTDPEDTHATPYEATDFNTPKPLKVSGSAYKLIRNRALHHGTCLLSSPNLSVIPHYLHSLAKPFITARGVESVSSPVGNISLGNGDFISAVQAEFAKQYSKSEQSPAIPIGEEWLEDESIRKGYEELKSPDWTYLQTPQFTVSTKSRVMAHADLELNVRYGVVTEGFVSFISDGAASRTRSDIQGDLVGRKLHEIASWKEVLGTKLNSLDLSQRQKLIDWLQVTLPRTR